MIRHYTYLMEGSGADGQTWKTEGTVDAEFHEVFHAAARASFEQLTQGRAQFGKPGVGCRGPYDIHRILIEQVKP